MILTSVLCLNQEMIIMLHNETRKLLIQAFYKTHNAGEAAECFSVDVKKKRVDWNKTM